MRRFYLQRDNDASGVSGTGTVAEGVVFSNGWVALTWLVERYGFTGIATYPSIETVELIHGHNGATRVVYRDEIPLPFARPDRTIGVAEGSEPVPVPA
jgi:hypothetical protein